MIAGTVGADRLDDTARAGVLRADVSVNVKRVAVGRPVSAGFVGLSIEYPAVTAYAGSDPPAINPVFEQLVRNLAPNQRPVLRIGGDSTDRTWWPVNHLVRPSGVTYSISSRWLAVARALADGTGARLILGVNLEANQSSIAVAEARALLSGIGVRSVLALEIGNEPNWYATLPWYRNSGGRLVFGRPRTYDLRAFTAEFSALGKRLPKVALAGPTVGALPWLQNLRRFLAAEPTLRVVTLHRYPLNRCLRTPGSPNYPTVANMLSSSASRGLARRNHAIRQDRTSARRHVPDRRDELGRVRRKGRGQRHLRVGALGPGRTVRRGPVRCRRCQYPHVSPRPLRPVHVSPTGAPDGPRSCARSTTGC